MAPRWVLLVEGVLRAACPSCGSCPAWGLLWRGLLLCGRCIGLRGCGRLLVTKQPSDWQIRSHVVAVLGSTLAETLSWHSKHPAMRSSCLAATAASSIVPTGSLLQPLQGRAQGAACLKQRGGQACCVGCRWRVQRAARRRRRLRAARAPWAATPLCHSLSLAALLPCAVDHPERM